MSQTHLSPSPIQRPMIRTAALGLAAAGAMYYNLLPLSLGLLQEKLALSNGQLGLLSAAFFLGFNLLSGTSFFWMQRLSWRPVAFIASFTALAAIAVMSLAETFVTLALISMITGSAFSALYAMSATIISEQENQTRWFGFKLTMEGLSGALLFVVLPSTLIASLGFDGILLGMAIVVLTLCPLWFWLPNSTQPNNAQVSAEIPKTEASISKQTSVTAVWLALGGTLSFFAGQTTIWAFIERLGTTAGYASASVTNLLSVTLLFAVAGSMTAAVLGSRLGNRTPFYICCLAFFVAAFGLNFPDSFAAYAFGACVATLSVAAGLVFGVSEIAAQDPNGKFIVLSVPAVGIGAMVGPGLAGFLADAYGFAAVLIFGVATVALGGLLFACIGILERTDS